MNYLTNHYKNLCEDLETKIKYLESLLSEDIPNINGADGNPMNLEPLFAKKPAATPPVPVQAPSQMATLPQSINILDMIKMVSDPTHPIHQNPQMKHYILGILSSLPQSKGQPPITGSQQY